MGDPASERDDQRPDPRSPVPDPGSLLRVALFGPADPAWVARLRLADVPGFEADGFDVRPFADDAGVPAVLAEHRPQVIVTLGPPERFPRLLAQPIEVRKRWVSVPDPDAADPAETARRVMHTFVDNVVEARFPDEPLVSVFTPTYKTGNKLERPWHSLLAQSYQNWEWVLVDDSPDDGATFDCLAGLASADPRVRPHRADRPSGNIGAVKRAACGLCRGRLLVELDHDDELTPDCLRWLVDARVAYPAAGFFFTDCAETFEDGRDASYGDDWGMGFGSYRRERWRDRDWLVANYPEVNAKTIRHIVGVPNHVRAWTAEAYWAAGGHHPDVHVCDDYELLIRTFLTARMVHVRRFGYVQYMNTVSGDGNAHRARNAEIQRLVSWFRWAYEERIHARFAELGVADWVRDGDRLDLDAPVPDPVPIANLLFDGERPITHAPGLLLPGFPDARVTPALTTPAR